MAKRFFYLAMGVLALAISYHLGAAKTNAQSGGAFVGVAVEGNAVVALTSTGDLYRRYQEFWTYEGNFLVNAGGPVPVDAKSFGAVKEAFRR
jgi:hypothetical protein